MSNNPAFQEVAGAYAAGVRALLAPPGTQTGERGMAAPASYPELAEQAGSLADLSGRVTATAGQMEATGPERIQLDTALLAKAVTDLELSTYLLQAAEEEAAGMTWPAGVAPAGERAVHRQAVEPYLLLLLGRQQSDLAMAGRDSGRSRDLSSARAELFIQARDTLAAISGRAGESGQRTLEGLAVVGLNELSQAARLVGLDVAQVLTQTEPVSRLFHLFGSFLQRAYETVLALFAPDLVGRVLQEVQGWLDRFKEGEGVNVILRRLYRTEETTKALRSLIMDSSAPLNQFLAGRKEVSTLTATFHQQTELVNNLLPKLKYLTLVPVARLPQGKVALVAAYMILCGYVILVGADYVDARGLARLDRVPGVYRLLEARLAPVER